ncbi:MAG: hypothetical protein QGG40_02150, partial [Myxococcota bacterium]|nr:hypothetical protein [Myxococcota bacterium]
MSRLVPRLWMPLLVGLVGCDGMFSDPRRTAIKVMFTGDATEIQAAADRIHLVVDPEDPYYDGWGDLYEAGQLDEGLWLDDVHTDDEELELVIEV